MRLPIAALALLSLCTSASADFYVADNHSWTLTCNASGYQLRSRYPVSRFIEAGVNSSVSDKKETLNLGKSCDAQHDVLGHGKWCWANAGFSAEFASHAIRFPRQELICGDGGDDSNRCGC